MIRLHPIRFLLLALPLLALAGCTRAHLVVTDQGTGVAAVQARAVVISGGREQEVDSADGAGRLSFAIPEAPDAIVAVRAQGFVQWSKTAAWLRAQPQPVAIDLEPLWMGRFLATGQKPSQIVTPVPCHCHDRAK